MKIPTCLVKLMTVFFTACAVSLPAFGQNPRLQIKNLERLSSKASEVVDVTLDEPMLKLAAKFMANEKDEDDVEARELIKDLKGVYVKSFEFDKEGEYSQDDVEAIRSQLAAPGWTKIVGVRSKHDGDTAEVYLMTDNNTRNILGMAIIAADPETLTVVNLVGPIDLEKLSALEGKMGIPHLEMEKGKAPQKQGASHDEKK
ncbi:MAG: DUF4252 domain-containing protein [Terriglobia bacterium]